MKRLIPLIGAVCALLFGIVTVTAQQQTPVPTLPLAPSPTLDPTFAVSPTPTLDPALVPEVTQEMVTPTLVPAPSISDAETEALPVLLRDRVDLDLLAEQIYGFAERPAGWTGEIDPNNSQLALLIRYDLELLAAARLGPDARPEGWFGGVVSVPLAFARDIRHDLELLADLVMGTATIRPAGWQGDDPLMRCDRTTQALITVLNAENYGFNIDFGQSGLCDALPIQIAQFVESQILQPPPLLTTADELNDFNSRQPFRAENYYVVAFYDRKARNRAGVLPEGTGFAPISRSGVEFSNMMLIEGNNFRIFVDYLTTPVTTEQFYALPEMSEGTQVTLCNADWCGD
ncbi:MAG: hypothetical protein J0M07_18635 [Anaerolineae bacterium]|nr:hypothetical protein [Anaerolineae bacterium]